MRSVTKFMGIAKKTIYYTQAYLSIPDAARVENTPRLSQGQVYRYIPNKVALFRRAPALKRGTRGGLEGGVRQATPMVNPFVYVSLVSVVE